MKLFLPILLMCYLKTNLMVDLDDSIAIGEILKANGWTFLTAINMMLITLMHFPCATTLMTNKKKLKSWKWTLLSFVIPTACGIVVCMATTGVYNLFRGFIICMVTI